MNEYQQGFLDALLLVEQLALKTEDEDFINKIEKIINELRTCIYEKRVEQLMYELKLF